MKVTLLFPTYLHLSGFLSVTGNAEIEMDLRARSLTAIFTDKDIGSAIETFGANISQGTAS
jgi:hypothetical protein